MRPVIEAVSLLYYLAMIGPVACYPLNNNQLIFSLQFGCHNNRVGC